jgi:hypothetical protein
MKRLLTIGGCVLGASMFCPSLLGMHRAEAAEPVPMLELSDDLPPPSARTNTLLLGGVVFGGFYGAAVAASYGWDEDPGAADLRIPMVGPWLKLGQTELCSGLPAPAPGAPPCSDALQVVGGVLAVVSGIGQIGGLALLLEGTFMRTRAKGATATWELPRRRLAHPAGVASDYRRPLPKALSMVPILTPSTVGAVMTGSF